MSASTRALEVLETAGIEVVVHRYEQALSGADTYGETVALALGVEPGRLFKTLIAEVDGLATVAIVPVSTRLSLKSLARAAGGKKAEMVDPARAERLSGYVTGGISPFGQKKELLAFVDETIELWDSVFVSGGQRGLQIELAPSCLLSQLDARVADLATRARRGFDSGEIISRSHPRGKAGAR